MNKTSTPTYQTITRVKGQVIRHPQFDVAYQTIVNAFEMNHQAGMAEHLVCVGESGTGKSTLKKEIEKTYPPYNTKDRRIIPVLVVDTPAFPTVKNMAEAVLFQLGDPVFFRGAAIEKTFRILEYLKKCDVKLIIFDELQHFIDQGHSASPRQVSDWLKTVIDNAGISTVLMGLERSEQILQINEQLRRRFSRHIHLTAFSINSSEDCAIFAGVLLKLEQFINLPIKMNLTDVQLLRRIHFATNGIIDYMVKLLLGAYEFVVDNSLHGIDQNCLEAAFTRHIWVQGCGVLNPFNPDFKWLRLDKEGMPFHKSNFIARKGKGK